MGIEIEAASFSGVSRKHEWTGVYDYIAWAKLDTSESASEWTITRLSISSAGNVTSGKAIGAWTDRASLTYN